MIRIIIREVTTKTPRAKKSIGVADIELIDQLALFPEEPVRDYRVRIHHDPPKESRVRWKATLTGFNPRISSHWHLIMDALKAVLPPRPGDAK